MAGMCLARNHHAHVVWVRQTKRMTSWMIRIFFSCTVAFAIPVEELLSLEAFWKGSIMGIIACIATKVLCAFFARPGMWDVSGSNISWIIGWAMVGRAEFAYLIAQLAASSNMMSPAVFAVTIWSLLYATVFAPFLFRYVLKKFVEAERKKKGQDGAEEDDDWEFRQSGHLPDTRYIFNESEQEGGKQTASGGHNAPDDNHQKDKLVHSQPELEPADNRP